jgi:hypothetical protein
MTTGLNLRHPLVLSKDKAMATRGIFQKTCPSCATHVAIDEQQCRCGYSFRTGIDVSELPAEEDQAQQQLLREYVKARLAQATQTLESLLTALSLDPKNFEKANRLMQAFADVRALRVELRDLAVIVDDKDLIDAAAKALAATPISAQPPQAFRAAQAQKAETIMQAAGMKTKECGKCRAVLPQPAVLCFCGYVFANTDAAVPATMNPGTEQRQGM